MWQACYKVLYILLTFNLLNKALKEMFSFPLLQMGKLRVRKEIQLTLYHYIHLVTQATLYAFFGHLFSKVIPE